eukprot:7709525-Lingulodinium_polyedra.AAC.1
MNCDHGQWPTISQNMSQTTHQSNDRWPVTRDQRAFAAMLVQAPGEMALDGLSDVSSQRTPVPESQPDAFAC